MWIGEDMASLRSVPKNIYFQGTVLLSVTKGPANDSRALLFRPDELTFLAQHLQQLEFHCGSQLSSGCFLDEAMLA